jgi:hypothetical protein
VNLEPGTGNLEPRARAALLVVIAALAAIGAAAGQLPLEPARDSGQSVTPAYEGWFKNADGTISLLAGYYNRNQKQALDIPVGPNNRVEPGGPDQGQPTHFLTHRQWGVFTIVVPGDFRDGKLTWTLVANGKPTSVPMSLHKDYEVEPLRDAALGNTPPIVRVLDPQGRPSQPFQGPPRTMLSPGFVATVGQPLTIAVSVTDDNVTDPRRPSGPSPLTVSWSEFRGPGSVAFSTEASVTVGKTAGQASTAVTFGAPGEYVVRVQANDVSDDGGGGFQCCWTNVLVTVTVR